jgi:membrane-associated phospholipid phosphatase
MSPPVPDAGPVQSWIARMLRRFGFQPWLKAVGTTLFMVLFFRAYFALLENPRQTPTVMPEIWLDHWIDFTPAAFGVYLTLWVYVSVAPALIGNLRALIGFGAWIAALCILCLGLFWLWPTQTPAFGIDWGQYPGLALIKGVDASGNACPSLHVASAVFTACWMQRILRELSAPTLPHLVNWGLCVAIAWSTLATLQHVALDVFAGAALGLVFALASLSHIRHTGPAAQSRSTLSTSE